MHVGRVKTWLTAKAAKLNSLLRNFHARFAQPSQGEENSKVPQNAVSYRGIIIYATLATSYIPGHEFEYHAVFC